ncbi:unnamed protein product [Vitrella brassicaformis CCMP3155]|uniref:Uncharacterized protein n=1 Tax=Vitrella brassicaformis (strain CCMP3155) TaxID=1169540 RepID=A0A0G4GRL5_VITBC|nr:unnamed protein product [Vitrella brassicaformis CCMP3155]|eukprot:CEM33200.1 unnamed protein product [Vitrella brassicaformis CCMP3155]
MLDLPPRVEQDGHCVFVDRLACVDPICPSSKRDQQRRADLKPRQHQQVALDSADPRQAGIVGLQAVPHGEHCSGNKSPQPALGCPDPDLGHRYDQHRNLPRM